MYSVRLYPIIPIYFFFDLSLPRFTSILNSLIWISAIKWINSKSIIFFNIDCGETGYAVSIRRAAAKQNTSHFFYRLCLGEGGPRGIRQPRSVWYREDAALQPGVVGDGRHECTDAERYPGHHQEYLHQSGRAQRHSRPVWRGDGRHHERGGGADAGRHIVCYAEGA